MNPFFDTNILVYAVDRDAGAKRDVSLELLARFGRLGRVHLSFQVLQEFFVVVTRKLARPLEPADARAMLGDLSEFPTVRMDRELLLAAADRHLRDKISFWDAMIVEAARKGGCDVLFSEDLQAGRIFDGLRVVNPYEESV